MNKFSKLKPPKETPETEICKCSGKSPIVLQSTLTYNPIACADCNLEVDIIQFTFSKELIHKIASWRNFHDCFYRLWLDSKEFEDWAKEQLSNPNSPVNKRGLAIKNEIGRSYECFYWWFVDHSSECYKPLLECPNCNGGMIKRENKFNVDTQLCRNCDIIIAN